VKRERERGYHSREERPYGSRKGGRREASDYHERKVRGRVALRERD